MSSSYNEKLSILSEMIAFARTDKVIKESEYLFLVGVAAHLGVDKDAFDELLHKKVVKKRLKSQADRIVQFHRLILLMNIDQHQQDEEIENLYNIGLNMGLPPSAIGQVLEVMHLYPNMVVPPDVLIKIFKAHYN
ncbi:MAG: TerB family tellurite resistance protein [Croceitalea sp.]|nr:TerB family tellurite resistance protein [Croceitalea sp.]NNM19438.1 TerB family tellurite resistance protein [Croceitalea sp.]